MNGAGQHVGAFLGMCCAALLAGCSATIDQESFFPAAASAPASTLIAPAGYTLEDALIELPGLGQLHVVRLDNPASKTAVVYSGGNGNFVASLSARAGALAEATGADLILYDYPGRGGTTIASTIDASLATGPAMVAALKARGWIGEGPVYAYGFSFGGSQAAAMVREGGFAGLVIESSAADIAAVGRNFVPKIAKPFIKLEIDPALAQFDYLGYASVTKVPVLLLSASADTVVTEANMKDFADQLRARGVAATMVVVPGVHGAALGHDDALAAIKAFIRP